MLRVGKVSKLRPAQVVEKATAYFGGHGLAVTKPVAEGNVSFEGGGGYVSITTCEMEKGTEVNIETREWDYQVKEFLSQI